MFIQARNQILYSVTYIIYRTCLKNDVPSLQKVRQIGDLCIKIS